MNFRLPTHSYNIYLIITKQNQTISYTLSNWPTILILPVSLTPAIPFSQTQRTQILFCLSLSPISLNLMPLSSIPFHWSLGNLFLSLKLLYAKTFNSLKLNYNTNLQDKQTSKQNWINSATYFPHFYITTAIHHLGGGGRISKQCLCENLKKEWTIGTGKVCVGSPSWGMEAGNQLIFQILLCLIALHSFSWTLHIPNILNSSLMYSVSSQYILIAFQSQS